MSQPAASLTGRTRYEALMPIVLAFGGAMILWLGGNAALWMWLVVGAIGLSGAAGFFRRSGSSMVLVSSGFVLAGAVILSAATDGTSSVFRFWFAGAAIAYPLVLSRRSALAYPVMAAALYGSLAVLPDSREPLSEVAAWAFLLVLVGVVVATLGQTSSKLAVERTVATQQMNIARGRLEAAFAAASSGMALIDDSGTLIRSNQALCEMLGRSADELAATSWRDMVLGEDVPELESAMTDLLDGAVQSVQLEVRLQPAGGDVRWALLGASVVDRTSASRQLFVHAQDITDRVVTTTRLQESEDHFRNLFGRSPVATWEQDFTGAASWLDALRAGGLSDIQRYLEDRPSKVEEALGLIEVRSANDAAVELVEANSRDDMLGPLSEANFPVDGDSSTFISQLTALWNGLDRTESAFMGRTRTGAGLDGIVHWAVPRVNGRLQPGKVIVTVTNVTEYRQAQEALRLVEQRLGTVVSAAPIILFAIDRFGVLTLAEGQGLELLDLDSAGSVGRSVFELFRNSPQFLKAVRRAVGGESFTTTAELGNSVFDIRLSPIRDTNGIAGAIGVANDITVRKRTAERLEQLVRTKDEFVASVSHELRTPLTAVVGFATELRDHHDDLSRDEARAYIDLISGQAMEVADLVEDLLVAARVDIDTVSVFPEAVSVWEQVDTALASWPDELVSRVSREGGEVKAYADPIRLRQIIRNLLSNAQRYGGSSIVVDAERVGENVQVIVRDSGLGVPDRDRETIFDPYRRAHEGEGQPLSVGLGLTVSRQLARLMDGDLEYRYVDEWSEFILTLPAVL